MQSAFILSEYEDINVLLLKPIAATQRIKYTCFNVSASYIALGSTSGSIYLFTREPCTFQQVIPLSEGPVTHVLLSPDEKTLALSTKRGSVCVINIKPVKLISIISNEHIDTVITCLCWNDKSSEIYVGDNNGKVSTIVLSIFTVNGMFPAPSCALMHLDSSVVQMDYSSHYLLVSTLSRCYICDTSQEQFKQIGNKSRDGEYGGCFFKSEQSKPQYNSSIMSNSSEVDTTSDRVPKSIGSMIGLNEEPDENLVIYCTRPGYRLWEVNVSGTVVKTHQFKEALQPPSKIFKSSSIKSNCDNTSSNTQTQTQTINFSRLKIINKKYLLSYTGNNIFIIDPISTTILSTEFNNIFMINIIEDRVYIMTTLGTFHSLLLSTPDYLILKLYECKLLEDCLQSCKLYRSDFTNGSDNDINVITPIIASIQSNFTPQRLNSGIVVVNSGHGFLNDDYNNYVLDNDNEKCSREHPELPDNSDEIIFTNRLENMKISNGDKNEESRDENLESLFKNELTSIQTDVEPIYELINSLKSSLSEEIIKKILDSIARIKTKYDIVELKQFIYEIIRSVERHYFTVLLESIVMIDLFVENNLVIDEITRAFIDFNSGTRCICERERESSGDTEPKFMEVGINLLKFDKNKGIYLCSKVPWMWEEYFRIYYYLERDIIPLCLQSRDNNGIANLFTLIEEKEEKEFWEYAAENYKIMEKGICLICRKSVDRDDQREIIDWSEITRLIIKKKNIYAAVKFVKHLEQLLPHVKLKESVYQTIIFTKLLDRHGLDHTVEFDRNKLTNEYNSICSSEAKKILKESLEKDLEKQLVNKNLFGSGVYHWGIKFKTKSSICSSCTLSLQTPVLLGNNGISIFPCGHAYHVNCLLQKKTTKCLLH
ncbi:uncharacterized protein LOC123271570 [Cotesia glomerata]|uniref:RING-type domain-containing protein n=1 Tax=Cotesia glomerata TaxID=32391 RepID=A0AAV7IQZ0_COTGL|nr:uncharacterized protein LOC123271570 [Cotesia glomerata]KAH0557865.1 hypothetical protein KQX54_012450 [Cotesia glomerata]